ncbi:hypothetical protein [Salinilacihabitans rarus]|uniref:hypothetical protein n=1 Tax=Salinilacihabitans rarus TaxID=2961596 RepID=UPI0020C90B42|nr:hypothetical protein [Salinilacihabitans rarus]
MRHPSWRCAGCGERLYAHVEGGYWCPNCGRRDGEGRDGNDDGGGSDERERRVEAPA